VARHKVTSDPGESYSGLGAGGAVAMDKRQPEYTRRINSAIPATQADGVHESRTSLSRTTPSMLTAYSGRGRRDGAHHRFMGAGGARVALS